MTNVVFTAPTTRTWIVVSILGNYCTRKNFNSHDILEFCFSSPNLAFLLALFVFFSRRASGNPVEARNILWPLLLIKHLMKKMARQHFRKVVKSEDISLIPLSRWISPTLPRFAALVNQSSYGTDSKPIPASWQRLKLKNWTLNISSSKRDEYASRGIHICCNIARPIWVQLRRDSFIPSRSKMNLWYLFCFHWVSISRKVKICVC